MPNLIQTCSAGRLEEKRNVMPSSSWKDLHADEQISLSIANGSIQGNLIPARSTENFGALGYQGGSRFKVIPLSQGLRCIVGMFGIDLVSDGSGAGSVDIPAQMGDIAKMTYFT